MSKEKKKCPICHNKLVDLEGHMARVHGDEKPEKKTSKKKAKGIEGMNLYQKLHAVQGDIQTVLKTGYNSFNKYAYATEKDILAEVKPLLSKYRLALVATALEAKQDELEGKTKAMVKTRVKMRFTLVNIDNPEEKVRYTYYGEANDEQDKGTPKAYTMAVKYFTAKAFLVPTDDDTESDRNDQSAKDSKGKGKSAPKTENPKEAYEKVKHMITVSRNTGGLLDYAENKLPKITAFTKEQKEELRKLISRRIDEIDSE